MVSADELKTQLEKLKLVPVIALPTVDAGLRLAELLLKYDLPVAEITFRTSCAAAGMAEIQKRYPELLLLAGTVVTGEQVDLAIDSGAKGIVSPGFTPRMADYCGQAAVAYFPGVCTPSEVQMAMEKGLRSLKFFPAELSGGVKMVSLFKALYRDVAFMPTGGITEDNLSQYLGCDNVPCCGGTWLSPESLMVEGEWGEIEQRIQQAANVLGFL